MQLLVLQTEAGVLEEDEGTTQEIEMEQKTGYHELYLQHGALEYITPINFEDGMDWDECELYYASIADGTKEFRSTLHIKRSTQIRRPTKIQIKQHHNGEVESCLRVSSKARIANRPTTRRSISFNTLPKIDSPYSQCLGDSKKDEFSTAAHVHFDDYVSVVTTIPAEDYPFDVRESLWMTKREMDDSLRDAMREESLRRAHAKHRAMQASQKKLLSQSSALKPKVILVLEEEKTNPISLTTRDIPLYL